MILVDTSAWVEYDRATGSAVDQRLRDLIDRGAPLTVTEPIVMEVVAGARSDEREIDLRRLLARFDMLRFDAVAAFGAAARSYRDCARVRRPRPPRPPWRLTGSSPRVALTRPRVAPRTPTGSAPAPHGPARVWGWGHTRPVAPLTMRSGCSARC